MKRTWAWALRGAVLGWLVAMVCWAPARWLAAALAYASGAQVQLLHAQGTLWQGSAFLQFNAPASGAWRLPSRVFWRWRGLHFELQAPCCVQPPMRLVLEPTAQQLRVQIADMQLPLQLLQGLGAPWNTLGITGTLAVQEQNFFLQWRQGQVQLAGSAAVQLNHLASHLAPVAQLGSYRVQLLGGAQPQLELTTHSGMLQLRAQGRWPQGLQKGLRLEGVAQSAPQDLDALANILTLLGERRGNQSAIRWGL